MSRPDAVRPLSVSLHLLSFLHIRRVFRSKPKYSHHRLLQQELYSLDQRGQTRMYLFSLNGEMDVRNLLLIIRNFSLIFFEQDREEFQNISRNALLCDAPKVP
jgi:hypothetical protein